MSRIDHRANSLADGLAKLVAGLHRVPLFMRTLIGQAEKAIEFAAAMVGVVGEASDNHTVTKLRADGSSCTVVSRDSMPMTSVMRKDERRKATEAKIARKAAITEAAEATKQAKLHNTQLENCRKDEDLARRQELAMVLLQGANATFETSDDDGVSMELDLRLTTPVEHTDGGDDMEMLFENAPVEWDWSLTQATGLYPTPDDDIEHLFQTAPGKTEFDLDDAEWKIPEWYRAASRT